MESTREQAIIFCVSQDSPATVVYGLQHASRYLLAIPNVAHLRFGGNGAFDFLKAKCFRGALSDIRGTEALCYGLLIPHSNPPLFASA